MIFVAQPYFSVDSEIIKERVRIGASYCGALLNQGWMCMSPVMFGTAILEHADLPGDFSFWDKLSFAQLEKCDVVHVLTLPGWDKSRGVKAEIDRAYKLDMGIIYITPKMIEAEISKSLLKLKS